MKRNLLLILTILLVTTASTAPVVAKDHGKDDAKTTSESCKKDGWKDLTDQDDQPFKTQGQCIKYTKQGGELNNANNEEGKVISAATGTASEDEAPGLKIVEGTRPWDGYLEGTGFTPGGELTKVTFTSDREVLSLSSPVGTTINDDGTFRTERIIYWCSEYHGYGETSGTVTVEDSAGESYSQIFEMSTHCGPKE